MKNSNINQIKLKKEKNMTFYNVNSTYQHLLENIQNDLKIKENFMKKTSLDSHQKYIKNNLNLNTSNNKKTIKTSLNKKYSSKNSLGTLSFDVVDKINNNTNTIKKHNYIHSNINPSFNINNFQKTKENSSENNNNNIHNNNSNSNNKVIKHHMNQRDLSPMFFEVIKKLNFRKHSPKNKTGILSYLKNKKKISNNSNKFINTSNNALDYEKYVAVTDVNNYDDDDNNNKNYFNNHTNKKNNHNNKKNINLKNNKIS